jgi:hypothetical protein
VGFGLSSCPYLAQGVKKRCKALVPSDARLVVRVGSVDRVRERRYEPNLGEKLGNPLRDLLIGRVGRAFLSGYGPSTAEWGTTERVGA